MEKLLTDQDTLDIIKGLGDQVLPYPFLAEIEGGLQDFVRSPATLAGWICEIIRELSGDMCGLIPPKMPFNTGPARVFEMLREQFEADVTSAKETQIDEWQDDPDWFMAHFRGVTIGDSGPVEHPWGDDVVIVCRRAFDISLFQWWKITNSVREAAITTIDDNLLLIANGTESGDVQRHVQARLKDECRALYEKLAADFKREQAQAADALTWCVSP